MGQEIKNEASATKVHEIGYPESLNCYSGLRLAGHSIISESLQDGALLPIGGSIFSQSMDKCIRLDLKGLSGYIGSCQSQLVLSGLEKTYGEYLLSIGNFKHPSLSNLLGYCMDILNIISANEWTAKSGFEEYARFNKYSKEGVCKLTDILSQKIAACAELAVFATLYLENAGFNSYYFGGITKMKEAEYNQAHSWVFISHDIFDIIFDVARPHIRKSKDSNEYKLPRLVFYKKGTLESLKLASEDRLVTGSPFIGSSEILFGVGEAKKSSDINSVADMSLSTMED